MECLGLWNRFESLFAIGTALDNGVVGVDGQKDDRPTVETC